MVAVVGVLVIKWQICRDVRFKVVMIEWRSCAAFDATKSGKDRRCYLETNRNSGLP
jgi:hypothetical protein